MNLKRAAYVAWIAGSALLAAFIVVRGVTGVIQDWSELDTFDDIIVPCFVGGLAGLANGYAIKLWLRSRTANSDLPPVTLPPTLNDPTPPVTAARCMWVSFFAPIRATRCHTDMDLPDGCTERVILAVGYLMDGREARLGNSQRYLCENCGLWWKQIAQTQGDDRLICKRCQADRGFERNNPKGYPPLY